jgi:large repetitive protein
MECVYGVFGQLPGDLTTLTGLTLSASGTISGTPTTSGTFTYHITVRDSAGNSSASSCSVTLPGSCTITIAGSSKQPPLAAGCGAFSGSTGNGTVGSPYSGSVSASGGSGTYTFSVVSGLPPGLTLNSSTGKITGTPTTAGTYSLTFKVT